MLSLWQIGLHRTAAHQQKMDLDEIVRTNIQEVLEAVANSNKCAKNNDQAAADRPTSSSSSSQPASASPGRWVCVCDSGVCRCHGHDGNP